MSKKQRNILEKIIYSLEWFIKGLLIIVMGLMLFSMYKFHVSSEREYDQLLQIHEHIEAIEL